MVNFAERVSKARESAGFSKAEMSRIIGITDGAYSHLESGLTKTLKPEALIKFCKATKVSPEWLVLGHGSMRENSTVEFKAAANGEVFAVTRSDAFDYEIADPDRVFVQIPRLSIVVDSGSGKTIFGTEYKEPVSFLLSFLEAQSINPESAACLYVSGHDMTPSVNDKDLILIDLDRTAPDDGVYLVRLGEHSVKICRTEAHYSGALKIRYDNRPNYEEIIPADQMDKIEIVAKVVWKGGLVW